MTRKDYETIAAALAESRPAPGWDANKHAQYRTTVARLADAFKIGNARFDRARFFKACGLDLAPPDEGDRAQTLAELEGRRHG